MKENKYFLNTALALVLGVAGVAAVLVRTFAPNIIIPGLDIPNLVLLSLAALVVDHYAAPGAKRCWICVAVLSAVTFGLGGKALTDHVFLSQFLNGSEFAVAGAEADAFSSATGSAEVSDSATEIDAISGATVTTKAIIRCVNSAVAYVTGADIESSATSWGG